MQVGAYLFVMKNTKISSDLSPVWASLWNRWEDLCKQVPGEEKVKLFFWFTSFWSFCCNFFSLEGSCGRNRSSMPRRVPLLNRRWAFPFLFKRGFALLCPCSTDGELFHIFFKRGCVLSSFNWHVNRGWFMFPHRILFAKTLKKHNLLKNFVPEKHCNPMTPRTPCNSYIVWNISFWPEYLNLAKQLLLQIGHFSW